MSTAKAVGGGVSAFLVGAALALVSAPPAVLLAGIPAGAAAGFWRGGALAGATSGLLTGLAAAVLFAGVGFVLATSADRAAPGVGLSLVVLAGFAAVLAVQTTVAGAAAGFLRS